jgi:RNA polymerase sigma-70 factor, ECF subfamily
VITEALASAPATIGFRRKPRLDESSEQRDKTRLAVARAKEGDRDAIRFLYVTYSHNVYGYVRSIVRDDHEAEDVTQHVFARLISALPRYDDRGVPFYAWLLRMARNLAIDHIRANRFSPVPTTLDPELASSDDEFDRAEAVRAALATLPAEQREVVVLRHILGFSATEIADRTGRTESSVHGLQHRGRRALRRALEELECAPCTRDARRLAA